MGNSQSAQGAPSAVKAIKNNWDYLEGFQEIILIMMDADEPDQRQRRKWQKVLPVGKAKIANLPFKDANQCLLEGKSGAVIEAIFQAMIHTGLTALLRLPTSVM